MTTGEERGSKMKIKEEWKIWKRRKELRGREWKGEREGGIKRKRVEVSGGDYNIQEESRR
jgi:hypothetical protein